MLNQLMYALFLSTDDDGFIPEWKENMVKYDVEITKLGERTVFLEKNSRKFVLK